MFTRFFEYFSSLCKLVGPWGTTRFIATHLFYRAFPPREGKLAKIRLGEYVFYFSSTHLFIGLFKEIFFNESYYLEPTDAPIRVIDAGANIGVALLYVKCRAPKAYVICFEPNPAARAVLEKNIEANRWEKDVRVYPYALGKAQGTVDFFVEEDMPTSGGGSLTTYLSTKQRSLVSYKVEVRRLSDFIEEGIDLLKIDTEGAEFDILDEIVASQKINLIANVQLEYHYNPEYFKRPLSALLTLLEKAGFKTFVVPTTTLRANIYRDAANQYMVFAWRVGE
jgi:FkbM family methyltransferase